MNQCARLVPRAAVTSSVEATGAPTTTMPASTPPGWVTRGATSQPVMSVINSQGNQVGSWR
eukprot:6177666-Pleurochrysis_carterae.AAC.1